WPSPAAATRATRASPSGRRTRCPTGRPWSSTMRVGCSSTPTPRPEPPGPAWRTCADGSPGPVPRSLPVEGPLELRLRHFGPALDALTAGLLVELVPG